MREYRSIRPHRQGSLRPLRTLCALLSVTVLFTLLTGCSSGGASSRKSYVYQSSSNTSSSRKVKVDYILPVAKTVTHTKEREPMIKNVSFNSDSAANGFYKSKSAGDFSALKGLFDGEVVTFADETIEIGKETGMHFADFVTVKGVIWAYYIKWEDHAGTSKGCIGLAKSTDGVNFTDYGTVIHASDNGWDSKMATFPGVWYEDGTFYVVYEGASGGNAGSIGLATSSDGVNFKKQGDNGMILTYSGEGCEAVNIGTPDLIRVNGTWYLTYHSFDGVDCQICFASGKELTKLEKYEFNPILPTSKSGNDSGTTGRRDIVWYDGWFYMTYEISTDQPYESAVWGHKFACSKDFTNWEIVDPVYPRTGGGFGNDGPSFCLIDGTLWVYIRANGNTMTRYRLVIADSVSSDS